MLSGLGIKLGMSSISIDRGCKGEIYECYKN